MHLRRGFSLFELVVVLAIVGVASAIAAPRYGRAMNRYRAELAARGVSEELRAASEAARVAGVSTAVRMDEVLECVETVYTSGALDGTPLHTLCLASSPFQADVHRARSSSDDGLVHFGPDGRAVSEAWVVIASGDHYSVVTIAPGAFGPGASPAALAVGGVIPTPAAPGNVAIGGGP